MAQLNINFFNPENPYRFVDPIRKYKENDPYHYTVDNIPIKQLEENILWIKDVLENATVDVEDGKDGVYRENFMELKPFIRNEGPQNVIYVNPGRFTARINDAYNLTPLQIISRVSGKNVGELNDWDVPTITNSILSGTLEKFKSALAANALGMNGLSERSFVNPFTSSTDYIFNYVPLDGDITPFSYTQFNLSLGQEYPNFFTFLWGSEGSVSRTSGPARDNTSWENEDEELTGNTYAISQTTRNLFYADTEFIKKWRGVARTSIVDVPYTLSATVQNFENDEFSFYDENGSIDSSLVNSVNSRIDLLFIYSKPIDQTGTYISEFERSDPVSSFGNSPDEESPRRLTRAELGIVRGAGINMEFGEASKWFFANPNGSTGSPQILAHAADQANTDLGFASLNVHGSFPSPDDLMNLSPMLAEWLPKKHIALVGQTILPIAYIVVKKNAVSNGITVLENSDIIDIRPFFRTTELSYNERAGLAAAIPAPSLANPVATESYVDIELKKVYDSIPRSAPVFLIGTQYNVLDLVCDTSKLIRQGPGTANNWTVPFGGQYFGIWPSGTGLPLYTGTGSPPEISSNFPTRLLNWKNRSTGNNQLDGVFKPDDAGRLYYGTNLRFFVFTLERLPALYGVQPDGTEWDVVVDGVYPIALTNFAQMARNTSGGPLTDTYRPDPTDPVAPTAAGTYVTYPNSTNESVDQNINASQWVSTQTVGNSRAIVPNDTRWIPGWIPNQERAWFAGTSYFSDYQFITSVTRNNDQPPILAAAPNFGISQSPYGILSHTSLSDDVLQIKDGVTARRLFKPPTEFYGNRSVDIKIIVGVTNRINIKKLKFSLFNMRVR